MEKVLVLAPYNIKLLKAIIKNNYYDYLLVGDKILINEICRSNNLKVSFEIIDCKDIIEICTSAKQMINSNKIKKVIVMSIPNVLMNKIFDEKIIPFYLLKCDSDIYVCNGDEQLKEVRILSKYMLTVGINKINASLLYPNYSYEQLELKIISMLIKDCNINGLTLYDDVSIYEILRNNNKDINLIIAKNKDSFNVFIQSILNFSNYKLGSYYLSKDIVIINSKDELIDLDYSLEVLNNMNRRFVEVSS